LPVACLAGTGDAHQGPDPPGYEVDVKWVVSRDTFCMIGVKVY